MEMVKLTSYKDYLSLPVNRWNIPEPDHDEVRDIGNSKSLFFKKKLIFFCIKKYCLYLADELDLIIMPGKSILLKFICIYLIDIH
jgi:hypothetical protein